MEAYLARLMEENDHGDLMDDEYYLYAGEGNTTGLSVYPHCQELTCTP